MKTNWYVLVSWDQGYGLVNPDVYLIIHQVFVSGQSFDAIKAGGNELKKNKLGRGGAFTQNGCRFDLKKSNQ